MTDVSLLTAPAVGESEYSRSGPPSYPSSGPPSAIAVPGVQSEPPSYPSSGPPSGHFLPARQPRLSVPTLSSRFPPPTYDEAMQEGDEEEDLEGNAGVSSANDSVNWLFFVVLFFA